MINVEDPAALVSYLQAHRVIGKDDTPEISVLGGGVSSATVLVRRAGSDDLVVKQALPKLRVAGDWYSDCNRVHREALAMRWLPKFCPSGSIVSLRFEDSDQHVIVMQAVPDPHQNWKDILLAGQVDFDHVAQFAVLLAIIHRESFRHRNLVEPVFTDRSFFETLRLEPYYRYTASRVPEAGAFLTGLIEETLQNRLSLVHGDYSPKNILIFRGQLVLLDHEVVHFGDPAFDVGFSLAHLLSKAHHLPMNRLIFVQAALSYAHRYLEGIDGLEWSEAVEIRAAKHTLGCLLARVAGRSPLEYLSPAERITQRKIATAMMSKSPYRISELINEFNERLHCQ
jgi:hypothetical protein